MGLLNTPAGGTKKDLGGALDLAEKLRTYTFQRRIRASAFVFVVFGMLSIIPLLILPAVKVQGVASGNVWMQFLHAGLERLASDWMLLVVFLISITNLLLLFAVLFMLYAVLNVLENR
jgi:hypothetical protein